MLKGKITRITKKVIVLVTVFMCLLQTLSYGMTQQEAGEYLANWCVKFYNINASKTVYPEDEMIRSTREKTYQYGTFNGTQFYFDCVGWVSYAVRYGLGLGSSTFTCFAVPPGQTQGGYFANGFTCIYGEENNRLYTVDNIANKVQPGDILFQHGETSQHVLIYVGEVNGVKSVVHMIGPLTLSPLSNYSYCAVGRITSDAAAGATKGSVTTTLSSDPLYDTFNGLPTEGQYSGTTNLFEWIFNALGNVIDYIAGMFFSVIKVEVIGWTRIFENGVTDLVNSITQEEETSTTDVTSSKTNNDDEEGVITVEKIIFNKVPILDVNFFNFSQAGGQDLEEGDVIYQLRETLATWYEVFRRVAIVIMLGMLIYLGIMMSVSSISEKKASYKKALTAWVTGFVLIFFVHYIMILVLNVNSSFVNLFNQIAQNAVEGQSTEGTIYDTILTRAYSIPISISLPAVIIYMVLVYYMIKFLYVYAKRYIVVTILTLIAPVMVIKYTFENASMGKSGNAISKWLADYVFNVLIQTIHAIIYCSFMIIALKMSITSVAGFIIALVFLNFILSADKLLMRIFNFGKGKNVEEMNRSITMKDLLIGFSMTKVIASDVKAVASIPGKIVKETGNFVLNTVDRITGKDTRQEIEDTYYNVKYNLHDKAIEAKDKLFTNALDSMKIDTESDDDEYGIVGGMKEVGSKVFAYLKAHNDVRRKVVDAEKLVFTGKGTGDKKLDEQIKATVKQRRKLKKKMRQDAVKYTWNTVANAAKVMAAIPMMIVDPKEGFALASNAVSSLHNSNKKKDVISEGEKTETYTAKSKPEKVARAVVNAATLGGFEATMNEIENAVGQNDKIEKDLPNNMAVLQETGEKEEKIKQKYQELISELTDENEKEKEKLDKMLIDVTKDQVDVKKVEDEVALYMYESQTTELTGEDVQTVVNRLINADIYTKKVDDKYVAQLQDNVRSQFNKKLSQKSAESGEQEEKLEAKDIIEVIKDGALSTHKKDKDKLSEKQKEMYDLLEDLNRLETESTYKNKGKPVMKAKQIVKRITHQEN